MGALRELTWGRRKTVDEAVAATEEEGFSLKRELTALDGALMALTNTVLILMLGQTRVGFAMARDRLFPRALAATHPHFGTPARFTLLIAVLVSLLAGFTGIDTLADLVNIGRARDQEG